MRDSMVVSAKETIGTTNKRTIPLVWWRRLSQIVWLVIIGQWSFYGIFRCPFIVPYVSCQNCPVITCHGRLVSLFWGFWFLLPLSVLLFGRAFCGWACPGGLVNQWLGVLAPLKRRLSKLNLNWLTWGKVGALVLVLAVWLVWGQPRMAIPIRVGDFFASVGLTFEHAHTWWLVRSGVVIGFVLLGLLLANAWCRFACPTGGLLHLLQRFSLFRIYRTTECNDCDRCRRVCPMDTRPAENNCTNCADCVDICPEEAIAIGRGKGMAR